jgi:hypothetical protein
MPTAVTKVSWFSGSRIEESGFSGQKNQEMTIKVGSGYNTAILASACRLEICGTAVYLQQRWRRLQAARATVVSYNPIPQAAI